MDRLDLDQKDFTTQSGGVSGNIHQVCIIITEAAEEKYDIYNIVVNTQGNKPRSNNEKRKRKYMSPPERGELSCQQLITARRYPQTREEKC
jgi:hypothetical protein